ncbi:NAD-dependent epimerase/dehydratase family protein [Pseudofrankia asymbiotica]|uniref:UDP-glucose 4-epimerase n=1 Tax=Pseudofrankia asymbiotica TaxID=1834516 RepID=A0A1V2I4Q3_9ACTN|nr:NAD-dependent epimerase/dehydratase family protein [Pseudofrankia asymbiotica]ONH24419.1 NAD-dependent dehydratase [Pseudofrankia asymbiotica]
MRVLVTGGAGFIGSHVVDALVGEGHSVRVFDALLPAVHRTKPSVNDAAEFIVGDVTDQAAVDSALRGVDAVCHQAAMVGLGVDLDDLPVYTTHNDLGTAVLLAAMARRGVGRLVLASSMVVYGEGGYRCAADGPVRPGPRRPADLDRGRFEPPCPRCGEPLRSTPVTEDAPLDPRSVYAATKVAQEHLAAAWAMATGGTVLALRYHNVYGPRMPRDTFYAGVASIFRSALERGEPPRVFEDGGQLRDFVHVHDVARANLAALEHGSTPGRLTPGQLVPANVGSGRPHTVGEMASALAAAFGGPAPIVTGQYRAGDVRHIVASSDRAHDLLGYQAAVTFTEGMTAFAHDPLRG